MTQNQLAYQANLEKARANLEAEKVAREQAAASTTSARAAQVRADVERSLQPMKVRDYESQIERRAQQTGIEIAKLPAEYVSSLGKVFGSLFN